MSTLLLTGATGMLGRELLARAVADAANERVLCLVRPGRDGTSPQARLDQLLERVGAKPILRAWSQ